MSKNHYGLVIFTVQGDDYREESLCFDTAAKFYALD
jgi:hypothetical protein